VNNTSKSGVREEQGAAKSESSPRIQYPRLSLWRRMQIRPIAWAAYWLMRLIGPTLRTEIVGVYNAIQIRDANDPGIGVFWHRCIFPAIWIWRNRQVVVLNTVNFDGQWTRRVIERLGFHTVQGSSSRGGIESLTRLAQRLDEGHDIALTIDGPRGPRYVAKPGAVILARRTGYLISPLHIAVESGHTFEKSWDQFRLPYPFSRVVMFIAPPVKVPQDADAETMKSKQDEVQAALDRVRKLAESWFGLTEDERDRLRDEWSQPGARRLVPARSFLPDDPPA
jgi:lysophospholipid acyltransferase (LPLAT)-like uncharacterized protein